MRSAIYGLVAHKQSEEVTMIYKFKNLTSLPYRSFDFRNCVIVAIPAVGVLFIVRYATSEADNLSNPEKFKQLRKLSAEEVQEELNDLRNDLPIESTFPTPRVPVYLMTIVELQLYLQDLVAYILKTDLQLKANQFRKWPIQKADVGGVLLHQSYYGR